MGIRTASLDVLLLSLSTELMGPPRARAPPVPRQVRSETPGGSKRHEIARGFWAFFTRWLRSHDFLIMVCRTGNQSDKTVLTL